MCYLLMIGLGDPDYHKVRATHPRSRTKRPVVRRAEDGSADRRRGRPQDRVHASIAPAYFVYQVIDSTSAFGFRNTERTIAGYPCRYGSDIRTSNIHGGATERTLASLISSSSRFRTSNNSTEAPQYSCPHSIRLSTSFAAKVRVLPSQAARSQHYQWPATECYG